MKKYISLLARAIPMLLVVFIFGATLGYCVGADPYVSGAVITVGAALFKLPTQSLAMGLNVSEVALQLGEYVKADFVQAEIWKRMLTGLELEQYMFRKSNVTGKFSFLSSDTTEVIQAFQKQFTPKGTTSFVPYINEAFHQKVDFQIDNIDELYDGYLNFFTDETKLRKDWPFVRYVMVEHIMPKMLNELNIQAAQGSYVAPTSGTAGPSIAAANGILTIVENEISDANLDEITTGAIDATNAVNKIEGFLDSIDALDPNVLKSCKYVFCNKTIARHYQRNYRQLFGSTNAAGTKGQLKLDDYNLEVVGLDAFAGKNRLMTTPDQNLVVGYNKIYQPNSMDVQLDKRVVNLLADFWRGYGFRTLQNVYVNDQE